MPDGVTGETPTSEWRLFACCGDGQEECGYAIIHRGPVGAHRERACDMDFCPECGSHLTLLGSGGALTVTNDSGRSL